MQELKPEEMELEPIVEAQQTEEQPVEVNEEVKEAPREQPKTNSDRNWEETTKVLKTQRQEIEQLRAHLEEVKRATAKPEVDEFADLAPDDVITFEQAKRLAERQAEAAAKKIVEEYGRNLSYGSQEQQARTKFEDYDYVVENFAVPMIQQNPALAAAIKASPDPFTTAYKLAKTSDQYEAQVTKQQISPKAEKVLKNASRPIPANTVSPSLKGQADQFAKMSKQDIWKQAQEYARGA
jgi:hypothetical protein